MFFFQFGKQVIWKRKVVLVLNLAINCTTVNNFCYNNLKKQIDTYMHIYIVTKRYFGGNKQSLF